jgi:hypothetical protein
VYVGMRGYVRICVGIDDYCDILMKRCEQNVDLYVTADGSCYWILMWF